MELSVFFKSVIDSDHAPIVLCDLDHTILYMNPAAIRNYAKRGGEKLIGQSLLACHHPHSQELIRKTVAWFRESPEHIDSASDFVQCYNSRGRTAEAGA